MQCNALLLYYVKRMFQQGTGLKVEEWQAQAQDMTQRLESAAKNERDEQALLERSMLETYTAHLQRMADYITKQASDARGWIKDPEKLKVALEALHDRQETVQKLASVLAEMQQEKHASPAHS